METHPLTLCEPQHALNLHPLMTSIHVQALDARNTSVGASNWAKHQRQCAERSCVVCGARHESVYYATAAAETKSLLDARMTRARQAARSHLMSSESSAQRSGRDRQVLSAASRNQCSRSATKGFLQRPRACFVHVQS